MTKVFKFIYVIINFSFTLISHKKLFKFIYVHKKNYIYFS
jgi:hypothetical protein